MQLLDVTVVIPVFNSAGTLKRAIESVLQQTLPTLELLVVDDGSADDSLAVAQHAATQDTRVKVVAMPSNGGKARAMNHAATLAKGRWIAVLDADDRYQPDRLAMLVAAGDEHDVDLVADNQLHLDAATGDVVRQAFSAAGPGRVAGLADFIAHSDPGATFDFGILKPMVRTAFLREHDLEYYPDAKLAEDFYFLLDFLAASGRMYLVHAPLYEWTLPFSPTTRRWTNTGSGAWRYDYRNALATNQVYQRKLVASGNAALLQLVQRREREYRTMVHYLDAQRILADTGSRSRALSIIVAHPRTWPLLARRVAGRAARAVSGGRAAL